MKKIIYTRPDGVVCVVNPVINSHSLVNGKVVAVRESISEDQALARAIARLPNYAKASHRVVDESSIPQDRTYRNGWKAIDGRVEHDMAKCREIHRQRLREMRAPLLASLDVAYMRADESGDQVAKEEIKAKKQALRDVTDDPRINQVSTVEELKTLIPAILL
jgi:hypothetical protein